ncbi:MAG TPA: ribonuclease E/G [Caulobacteraceae bacterium]|jgi:Ribonuclease G/E
MSRRRFFLDPSPGETRAVVTLDGRPERLIIARHADPAIQAHGAQAVARVRAIDRNLAIAFLDLGTAPDAVLNLEPQLEGISEGAFLEVEIRAEARAGKGARARWLGPAKGPARLLEPGPNLEARLGSLARGAAVETGPAARTLADTAQDEVLETHFLLPTGGNIAIETTRALVAIDVDVGAQPGGTAKRAARTANQVAIAEAARLLRLKGLGGLVVIDLAGRGHDGAALLAAAKSAFAPDSPGVAFGPVSRFGTLELTIPRRMRPSLEILAGDGRVANSQTQAMALLRSLEREALTDGGGRFEARAAPGIAAAAAPYMSELLDRLGARLSLRAEADRSGFEVRPL